MKIASRLSKKKQILKMEYILFDNVLSFTLDKVNKDIITGVKSYDYSKEIDVRGYENQFYYINEVRINYSVGSEYEYNKVFIENIILTDEQYNELKHNSCVVIIKLINGDDYVVGINNGLDLYSMDKSNTYYLEGIEPMPFYFFNGKIEKCEYETITTTTNDKRKWYSKILRGNKK